MRVVYQAENILDAHLVRGALEHEGVRAWVTGEYLTGAIGQLPVCGLVAVMVDERDLDAAHSVIAALELARAEAGDEADEEAPEPAATWIPKPA